VPASLETNVVTARLSPAVATAAAICVAFTQLVLLVTPALPNLALNTNKGVFFFWNTNKGEKYY